MVLKCFILPEMYSKQLWPALTHPTTQPRDYWGGEPKRGEGGLIKVALNLILENLTNF